MEEKQIKRFDWFAERSYELFAKMTEFLEKINTNLSKIDENIKELTYKMCHSTIDVRKIN